MVWHRTRRMAVLLAMGLLLGTAQNALAGDCNSNGTDDAADIALGTSQDCNLNALPDECELANNDCNHNAALDECEINIGPMELFAQGAFGVGDQPNAVIVADLNEDGEPDVAVTNFGGTSVSILLNQGDGTLLNTSAPIVGSLPVDITAGDFDDDGDIDLAVSNTGGSSKSVTILLNVGFGTGIFFVGSTIELGVAPWGIEAVDLDGDTDLDLAVVTSDGVMRILENDGSAGFTAGAVVNVGSAPRLLVSADLDGDGDHDLIVANLLSDDISVLFNNGDATFAPEVTYAVGDAPLSLVAADLDGDGDVDIAVANQGPDTVSLFTNDGDGNLELTQTLPVGADPKGIVAVDLDGNGSLDLATADFGFDTISILMNAGGGGFALLGSYCAGSSPSAIVAGDFGGPGAIDLVTANNADDSVSILVNIATVDCLDCDGNRRIDSCEAQPFTFGFEAAEGFHDGDINGQQSWFRGRIVDEFVFPEPPPGPERIYTIACPDREEIRFNNVDCAAATLVTGSPIGTGMALRMQVDQSLEDSDSWAVFSPNSTTCARGIYVWEWDTHITNLDGPDFNVWIQDDCGTEAAAVLIKYEFDGDVRFYDWFFEGFINTGFTFEPGETFSTRITINLNSEFVTMEFNDTLYAFASTQAGSDAQEIAFENDNFFSDSGEDAAYFDNISVVALADCNSNGIDDLEDIAEGDSDDSNNDGIPDECQEDCNGDGDLDPNDCNGNCVIDECDLVNGTSLDCNGNDIPDLCDVIGGESEDCNGNDVPDECDIDSGSSEDADGNGIPDECEQTECEGDANGDGLVDPLDSGFILARFGCTVGGGDSSCDQADQNGDGVVDPLDVGFVLARFGPCP